MSDIQALSASIGADVAQFLTAMQQSAAAVNQLVAAQGQAQQSSRAQASAIGASVEAYNLAAQATRAAAQAMVSFGETAISAANNMDPQGAAEWAKSMNGARTAFMEFAGAIGKEVRPQLEAVANAAKELFNRLAAVDWGSFTKALMGTLDAFAAWATSAADILTSPFRELFGYIENVLGKALVELGGALNKLGGTSIGKKLGLNEYSGDAVGDTGKDLQVQGEAIAASWKSAFKEVSKGIETDIKTAVDAAGQTANWQKFTDSVNKAFSAAKPGGAGGGFSDAQKIAGEEELFKEEIRHRQDLHALEQRDSQEYIQNIRQGAAVQKQEAMQNFDLAKQKLQEQMQILQNDRSSGNVGAIAGDQARVADALTKMNAAGQDAIAKGQAMVQAERDIEADLTTGLAAATEAYQKAKAAADAAARAAISTMDSNGQQLNPENARHAADAQAIMAQASQEMNDAAGLWNDAHKSAAALMRTTAMETKTITVSGASEAAKIQQEAAKASTDYSVKTLSGLAQHGLGSVGGGALAGAQAGFAAAGPMGAAVGAGASLLENSSGFKKFADAMNGIFQPLADAVGQLLGPLVPVVKAIGEALKPLIDALGGAFLVAGKALAAAITPLVPIIADIAEPLAGLIDALSPLLGIIQTISMVMTILDMGLLPVIVVLKALRPALDALNKAISIVIDAIVTIWNGIVDAIAGVIKALAHALPGELGDDMWAMYYALENMKGQTAEQAAATATLTDTIKTLTDAANGGTLAQVALTQAQRQAVQQQIDSLRATATQAEALYQETGNAALSMEATAAANAANQLASDLSLAGNAAASAAGAMTDGQKAYHDAQAKQLADNNQLAIDKQALADAKAHGASASVIASFTSKVAQDAATSLGDYYRTLAAEDLKNGGSMSDATYIKDMAQAALADSSATAANTKATQALTATLGNMVGGFRAGAYDQGGGAGPMGVLAGQVGGGGVNIYGDVHVTANEPGQFGKAMRKHAASRRRGGSGSFS